MTNTESRLDRVEAILASVAEQQQATAQLAAQNAQAITQLTQRFDGLVSEVQRVLNQSGDRQVRTEATVEFLTDAVTRLTQSALADREEFRRIWEYLESQQRSRGNGHG